VVHEDEEEEMAAWKRITVRSNLYSRLEGQIRCAKCGELLSIGDEAWAHLCPRKKGSYTNYYCLMCFSKLWLWYRGIDQSLDRILLKSNN